MKKKGHAVSIWMSARQHRQLVRLRKRLKRSQSRIVCDLISACVASLGLSDEQKLAAAHGLGLSMAGGLPWINLSAHPVLKGVNKALK